MTESVQDIKENVTKFILEEFLPGEPAENLDDSTPLIEGAVVDSIGIIKLAAFIQEQYDVEIEPHEMNAEFLGTIADISNIVQAKITAA